MTLTLTIEKLQEHNVCRDGQVRFRRHFGRSRTWATCEAMEADFREHASDWDWSEAVEKFGIDEDEFDNFCEDIQGRANSGEAYDEEGWSERQQRATAWCRLYWTKVIGVTAGKQSIAPAAAKKYLLAVEMLDKALKFKTKRTPTGTNVDFEIGSVYYSGTDDPIRKYIGMEVQRTLPAFIENAILHYEAEVARTKQALADVLAGEAVAVGGGDKGTGSLNAPFVALPIKRYTLANLPPHMPTDCRIQLSDVTDCEIEGVGRVDEQGYLHFYPASSGGDKGTSSITSVETSHSYAPAPAVAQQEEDEDDDEEDTSHRRRAARKAGR